jgi:hypothetical protein
MISNLQSRTPDAIKLTDFLSVLARSLENHGARLCVLRNYESLPDAIIGNDIDCLIRPSEERRAIQAMRSVPGISITGYGRRSYVSHFFSAGIDSGIGRRALQIDFALGLLWKGLPFLDSEAVLNAALPRPLVEGDFSVPSPVDEAIAIAMHDLLYGGVLKQRYLSKVQSVLVDQRNEVVAALSPPFGRKMAVQLTDAVIVGQPDRISACVRPLRVSLISRALLRAPLRSATALMRHHYEEFRFRMSRDTMRTVCIHGLNCGQKKLIVDTLMPMLPDVAKLLERVDLSPRLLPEPNEPQKNSVDHASTVDSASFWTALKSLALCLARNWRSRLVERKGLTLKIIENSYDDFLLDPRRYGYRGPAWLARFVGAIMPSPDLRLLLDDSAESTRRRLVEDCESKSKRGTNCTVLDSSLPPEDVAELAYTAIVDALSQRTAQKFERSC